jgi:hypothetical protein
MLVGFKSMIQFRFVFQRINVNTFYFLGFILQLLQKYRRRNGRSYVRNIGGNVHSRYLVVIYEVRSMNQYIWEYD